MKWLLLGSVLTFVLIVAGCAANVQPANLDDMPGSDHMESGPGVFGFGASGSQSSDGLQVYPTTSGASARGATGNEKANNEGIPSGKKIGPPNCYQYARFRRFLAAPEDSPQKKAFRHWQQWQRFRQWRQRQNALGQ